MWRTAAGYATLLAGGTLAVDWLDYRRLAQSYSTATYGFAIGAACLVIGVVIGARAFGAAGRPRVEGNPQARTALGISPREFKVLQELAGGLSNKEIAARLSVSPNTVKTHIARLFEKLQATRRAEAIHKARELGLVP